MSGQCDLKGSKTMANLKMPLKNGGLCWDFFDLKEMEANICLLWVKLEYRGLFQKSLPHTLTQLMFSNSTRC